MALSAIVGGSGVGWWLRGRYHWSRRVVMDELWTRKIRSYENATEQANTARTITESALLESQKDVQREQARSEQLEILGANLRAEHDRRLDELDEHRVRMQELQEIAVEIDQALLAEREEHAKDRKQMELQQQRLKSLHEYPGRLEESEAELATVRERFGALGKEKNAEIARLNDWIAELTPLTESLRRRGEELATQRKEESRARTEFSNALAARDRSIADLTATTSAQKMESHALDGECQQLRLELLELQQSLDSSKSAGVQLEATLLQHSEDSVLLRQGSIQSNLRITEQGVRLGQSKNELDTARALISELEQSLHSSREIGAKADQERGELRASVAELEKSGQSTSAQLADLQRERKTLTEELKKTRKELEEWLRESERAQETLAARDKELKGSREKASTGQKKRDEDSVQLADQKEELMTLRTTLRAKEKELEKTLRRALKLEEQRVRKAEQLVARDALLSELRGERTHLQKELRDTERLLRTSTEELEQARASQKRATPETTSKKKAVKKKASPKRGELIPKGSAHKNIAALKKDDLTAIKGVGPKVAARLSKAGFHTYGQLSRLQGTSLENFAETVGVPKSRIEREGWVQSATDLL
ncbi:MAG: putative flap endonuclease-1-like 5' DNA nuclease [Planctomycetota bacterium]